MKKIFISGIGTEVGKTYVTGQWLRLLVAKGVRASSFKLVQTGMSPEATVAEDIVAHRQLSAQPLSLLDSAGLSCGAHFAYPASPHLAAALEGKRIDGAVLSRRFEAFCQRAQAEVVLCEGAGGAWVPLHESLLTIDWAKAQGLALVLVCNAMLGSLHHTLSTLEALAGRGYLPRVVVYNAYPRTDAVIAQDSARFLQAYMARHYPSVVFCSFADGARLPQWLLD